MKNMCRARSKAECLTKDCKQHPQSILIKSNKDSPKVTPTRFYRYPWPICWFLAGNQFLSTID